jgi:hypothetical protein
MSTAMKTKRTRDLLAAAFVGALALSNAHAQQTGNPWLTDSVNPISHANPAQVDSPNERRFRPDLLVSRKQNTQKTSSPPRWRAGKQSQAIERTQP